LLAASRLPQPPSFISSLKDSMKHFKALTSQQLALASASTLLVAGIMLSRGNQLGFLFLAFAVACGAGAFVKFKKT
jgi:hypothetical protein